MQKITKKLLANVLFAITLVLLSFNANAQCGGLYIAGVVDGPLSGGTPKAIQLCATYNITNLELYAIGSANNGGGSDGIEYTLPGGFLDEGDCIWITNDVNSGDSSFVTFFGQNPCFVETSGFSAATSINGDDAIELFYNDIGSGSGGNFTLIDIFGDPNVDGTGQAWEYTDGWATRNTMLPSPTFNIAEWSFSGPNALDNATENATSSAPYPNLNFDCSESCPPFLILSGAIPSDVYSADDYIVSTGTVDSNALGNVTFKAGQLQGEYVLLDTGFVATGDAYDFEAFNEGCNTFDDNILTQDLFLAGNQVHNIEGKLVVQDGVTLTIGAGAILKFSAGECESASALVVAQGGIIDAQGTAMNPIIMTSELDDITVGDICGTNLTQDDRNLWGGLIVLGKAPISASGTDTVANIEGIASEPWSSYGGNDPADNSGIIQYVSVRHGGVELGDGNEINGITLGGVGTGTTIDHIEIVANLDDGLEIFGGTVNVNDVVVGYQGDDGIDFDQNYSGTVTNFYVKHAGTKDALEIDGPEGTTYTTGRFTLNRGTLVSDGAANRAGTFKSKAQGDINDVLVKNYNPNGKFFRVRASYDSANCTTEKTDAYSNLTDGSNNLNFTNVEFEAYSATSNINDYITVYPDSDDGCPLIAGQEALADMEVMNDGNGNAPSQGADISQFTGWSWMDCKDKLVDNIVVYDQFDVAAGSTTCFDRKIIVQDGGTLNIGAGAVLKFEDGLQENSSGVIIARGGIINATGTANAPIVFTSCDDGLTGPTAAPGNINGTLPITATNLWGGLIILGKANISASGTDTVAFIEGLPQQEDWSLYGGSDNYDNSGIVNYVSIRHGGIEIGEGNEINGLTLGGVGSGTQLTNIEVIANLDDGIEFFGGTADLTNAIVGYQGDDGIDLDQNYSGRIDNWFVKHSASKDGLEIDGPEGSTFTAGTFELVNGTLESGNPLPIPRAGTFKSKAQGQVTNVLAVGYDPGRLMRVRASFDPNNNCADKTDAYTNTTAGLLDFNGIAFTTSTTVSEFVDVYPDDDDAPCDTDYSNDPATVAAYELSVDNIVAGNALNGDTTIITGCLKTVFENWTWMDVNNELY